jgi:hypothetical protein
VTGISAPAVVRRFFVLAAASTAGTFWALDDRSDIF